MDLRPAAGPVADPGAAAGEVVGAGAGAGAAAATPVPTPVLSQSDPVCMGRGLESRTYSYSFVISRVRMEIVDRHFAGPNCRRPPKFEEGVVRGTVRGFPWFRREC